MQVRARVTYHIRILFQNSELNAGNFDGQQNARSDSGDACANDSDLQLTPSQSRGMVRRDLDQLSGLVTGLSDVAQVQMTPWTAQHADAARDPQRNLQNLGDHLDGLGIEATVWIEDFQRA